MVELLGARCSKRTSWLRKHRGAFWKRHVYGILAEIDLTVGNVTTDGTAENIKITVFLKAKRDMGPAIT